MAYPGFLLLQQRSFLAITLAYALFGLAYSIYLGPSTATIAEQFPTRVRAASIGIGYNLPVWVAPPPTRVARRVGPKPAGRRVRRDNGGSTPR